MPNLSNIKEEEIYYKQNIPYYKGMPCFAGGLRLNSHPYIDNDGFLSAYYWRDGGLWGCRVSELYPNIFAFSNEFLKHLYLSKATPMTFEEWCIDNGNYCPNDSNIMKALKAEKSDGRDRIKIGHFKIVI